METSEKRLSPVGTVQLRAWASSAASCARVRELLGKEDPDDDNGGCCGIIMGVVFFGALIVYDMIKGCGGE